MLYLYQQKMVVLIRCPYLHSVSGGSLRSSSTNVFSGKLKISGSSPMILFKSRKAVSVIEDARQFNPLSANRYNHSVVKASQASEHTYLSGVEGNQRSRISKRGVVFTYGFMLTTPLKALAETFEPEGPEQSFFNMPLLLCVALVGATVGGLLARQRRGEMERLNEQLRQINAALRRQAKIESYAPSLSYAPGSRIPDNELIVDPRKHELILKLKNGKNFLRNQQPETASVQFKEALELAKMLKDPTEEKKAARGLGASLQRQGKFRDAINYHSMVLSISDREGEDSGDTEAFGAIADCYTELGDLEKAGKFYDKYISRLEQD